MKVLKTTLKEVPARRHAIISLHKLQFITCLLTTHSTPPVANCLASRQHPKDKMSSAIPTEVPLGVKWDQVILPEQHLWSSVPFFHRCRSTTGSQILSLTNIGGPGILQSIHKHFKQRDNDVHVVTYPKVTIVIYAFWSRHLPGHC